MRIEKGKRVHILPIVLAITLVVVGIAGCVMPAPTDEGSEGSEVPVTDVPSTPTPTEPDDAPPTRTLVNPVIPAGTSIADVVEPGLAELLAAPDTPGVTLRYSYLGEGSEDYPVDDAETVARVLGALGNISLGEPATLVADDAGEAFYITAPDGTEYKVYFELGQLDVNGDFYEVTDAEALWETCASIRGL